MEKTLVLQSQVRTRTGSKDTARVRRLGRIPAIVYGHKQKPVAVTLNAHDFAERLGRGHRLMDIQIGKKKEKTIVKDVQYDHFGRDIIHVDLMRVDVTEMVKVTVPVELKGTAKGSHEGGIIVEHADHLEIECKVTDIPNAIVVSVKQLGIGDNLHAADIELPAGLKLISDPETLLVTCSLVAAAKSTEELEEEVPAAPEVIGEAEAEQAKKQTPEEAG